MSGILERIEGKLDLIMKAFSIDGTDAVGKLPPMVLANGKLSDTGPDVKLPPENEVVAPIDAPDVGEKKTPKAPKFIPPKADKTLYQEEKAAQFVAQEAKAEKEFNETVLDLGSREGLDKQGIVWDARIHAEAKVAKKTTGQWKRKRNISDEFYNQILAELVAKGADDNESDLDNRGPFFWMDSVTRVTGTAENHVELAKLLEIPTTVAINEAEFDAMQLVETTDAGKTVKKAPPAPGKKAPKAPAIGGPKPKVVKIIRELTDVKMCEHNDVTAVMVELTEFDTLAKVPAYMLEGLLGAYEQWLAGIVHCEEMQAEMQTIAVENDCEDALNDGIESILEPHNASCIGLVHYTDISDIEQQFSDYLDGWKGL